MTNRKLVLAILALVLLSTTCGGPDAAPTTTAIPPTPVPVFENELEYVSPEDVGWSSEKLEKAGRFAEQIGSAAVMALYDGKVFFSWGEVTRNFQVHSIRKPFLSALYGIHVARGEIDLDASLEELNIDDIPPSLTPEEKQATVRDLLKSRSGVYHDAAGEIQAMRDARPERGSQPPDTFYYYNNWDFNVLGTIFEQETGAKIFEEFKRAIADPIGMEEFSVGDFQYFYERDRSKHPVYAFRMSARDMARFGLLYQRNGIWNGQQIIPRDWITESTTSYSAVNGHGYGYMWNVVPEGSALAQQTGYSFYFHTGIGVHALLIVPDLKLVLVHRVNTDEEWVDPGEGLGQLIEMIIDARVPGGSSAAQEAQPALETIREFEARIERLRKDLHIPGLSVGVLHGQEVVLARGFGYADVGEQIAATENTPYHIASLTKPFAAAIIMQLVEAGQLDLDDEMADILKDVAFPFPDGTLDGYASLCEKIIEASKDRSGPYAPYGFLLEDYRCDSEPITVQHHLTHTSQGVPGEAYRYNGFLFGLLTQAVEQVSGQRFDELLVERFIDPLGMTGTFPNASEERGRAILERRAKPYRIGNNGNPTLSDYPQGVNAAAGMVSTVLDLAKFSAAMDRNLIVSEASKQAMLTPTLSNRGQPLPYGLGWFVQEHNGQQLVWHYGHQPESYSSLILSVPQAELTLILLANSENASAPFNLGAGNVLKSPFAVAFINLFTAAQVPSP